MNLKSYFKSRKKKNKQNKEHSNNSLMNKNSILYLLLYMLWRAAAVQEIYQASFCMSGAKIKWKATKQKKGTQG
jgi:hypothetical protein